MISKFCSTRSGREPHRGLVHQQQPRPRHQRAAHRDHLLLAARERAGELARAARRRAGRARRRARSPRRSPPLAQVGAHLEVLEHRHRREQAAVLGHDRDPACGSGAGRRRSLTSSPANQHAAAARAHDARGSSSASSTCPRRCRRAGRRARRRRPCSDDPLEDVDRPVVGVDVVELEQQRRRPLAAPPARSFLRASAAFDAEVGLDHARVGWRPPRRCPRRSSRRGRARRRGRRSPRRRACRARSRGSCSRPRRAAAPISSVISWVSTGFIPAAGSSSSSSRGAGRRRARDLEPPAVGVGEAVGGLVEAVAHQALAEEAEPLLGAARRSRAPRGAPAACAGSSARIPSRACAP